MVIIRNGGGGGQKSSDDDFPRAAWDRSAYEKRPKFPTIDPPDLMEPNFFPFFIRTKKEVLMTRRPREVEVLLASLLLLWAYGLWYNSKHGPAH